MVLWLAGVLIAPLVPVVAWSWPWAAIRLRQISLMAALYMLAVSLAVAIFPNLRTLNVAWPQHWGQTFLLGVHALRIDGTTWVLVPLPAALWLFTMGATPRQRLDHAGLVRTAVATFVTTLAFLSTSPVVLVLLWMISSSLFRGGLCAPEFQQLRRVLTAYQTLAVSLLIAGISLLFATTTHAGDSEALTVLGHGMLAAAVLVRKGILPFHAWVPEVFERGRIGPAVLFSAPQLGSYVAYTLLLPKVPTGVASCVVVLAFATSVYSAALALCQRDARRACGYLFSSQSALVLAGLLTPNAEGIAAARLLWLSSALAFTGIARCVLALEARRGRLELNVHHGGYAQLPLLAVSFLVLGLSCTGFPGTLGFVGETLLMTATVDHLPMMTVCIVVAGALTGLTVLRMYFSLFCGAPSGDTSLPLLRREALVFGVVAAFLIAAGWIPGALAGHPSLCTDVQGPPPDAALIEPSPG